MTAALGYIVALLAFSGWGLTLVLMTRASAQSNFDNARALEVQQKINRHIDDMIGGAIRAFKEQSRKTAPDIVPSRVRPDSDNVTDLTTAAMREGRSGFGSSGLGEMPMVEEA